MYRQNMVDATMFMPKELIKRGERTTRYNLIGPAQKGRKAILNTIKFSRKERWRFGKKRRPGSRGGGGLGGKAGTLQTRRRVQSRDFTGEEKRRNLKQTARK